MLPDGTRRVTSRIEHLIAAHQPFPEMFHREGADRTDLENRLLAGYLALVAGFVNSAGFICVGSFTSHATGNVGRLADDLALGMFESALFAGFMVIAFFLGAFTVSMFLESEILPHRHHAYGVLLLGEAALLALPIRFFPSFLPRPDDVQATVLCFAMGMQNSFVTRLSGAVVRTTHLTGVLTDIGIEAARWFRYLRATVGHSGGIRLTVGAAAVQKPHGPKAALLITVFVAFVVGSAHGAFLATRFGRHAFLFPSGALIVGALYALFVRHEFVGAGSRK
jgi:uncharacterized membrane protein YoaK (UPF0700 family)